MAERGEANRLGGRMARYARVGTAVGGLAVRLGAERVLQAVYAYIQPRKAIMTASDVQVVRGESYIAK